MKNISTISISIATAVALTSSASAGVIAWNFTDDWPAPTIQGAGVVDGTDQWTDSIDEAAPGTGTTAPNSTDTWAVTTPINAAMVSVAWTSDNLYAAGPESTSEEGLYRMYLDDGGTGPEVTLTGLSAWLTAEGATGYTIELYRNSDAASNNFAEVNFYEGSGTTGTLLDTIATEQADASSRLKQAASLTFTSDVLTFHTDSGLGGGNRAGISGFKITTVPEPSSAALLGLGGIALILRRRK